MLRDGERLRFVPRLLDGEWLIAVCREFGISRTGYKLPARYREPTPVALADRSRRPVRYADQLPVPAERLIVDSERDKPHWGVRKIRELLVRRLAGEVRIPATSTIHAELDRHDLIGTSCYQCLRFGHSRSPLPLPPPARDVTSVP